MRTEDPRSRSRSRSRVLALVLVFAGAPAAAAEPDDPEALAAAAVAEHPSLDALRARADALTEAAGAARLWSDPMLGGELSNLAVTRPWIDSHPMGGIQLKLQQRFPAPGETRARGGVADARIGAAETEVALAANALQGEVRERYWDLALVRQLREVTRLHLAELDGLLGAVGARYEVGVASQHDLLQLQLRRDRLAERLADFDAREAALLAALNGALARPPETPVGTPAVTAVEGLPADAPGRVAALAQHPELRVLRARAAVARAEADRARAEAAPEPTAWLGYRIRAAIPDRDPGTNFVTAGVSLPLPFASTRRWRAMEGAAEARARAADHAAAGKLERLTAALASAEAAWARAADRAVAYRDALEPAARAALESTLSAYQVDRAGFPDLIRAEIDLLDVQRQRLLSEAEAATWRARILTLLGGPDAAEGVAR